MSGTTTEIICAFIAGIPATIAAIAAWKVSKSTHKAVNSRMDKFLTIAEKHFHDEGVLDEKRRQGK
jgi:hypothetical protein